MKLWTIQPISVYKLIEKQGYYTCDEEKLRMENDVFDSCFRDAYNWLIKEMAKRIGEPPEGVKYPVWAWHTYDWKRKSSDLRSRQGKPGEEMVRLEIEIPDDKVVLTDFDAWHFVLNNSYISDCNNEEEYDKIMEWYDALDSKKREELKYESWKSIFDLTPIDTDWITNGAYIQATFWRLDEENIKKVKFFKSR